MDARLTLAGEVALAGDEVGQLAVDGDRAYVARGGRLSVVALGGGEPALAASVAVEIGSGVGRVAARDGRVLVGMERAVAVFAVSAVGVPLRRGTFEVGDRVSGLACGPGDVVLTTDGEVLATWRLAPDGGGAVRLGAIEVELARQITLEGGIAYVSADCNGVAIVEVADPARPRIAGRFEGPGDACGVAMVGSRAYLADYSGGVWIVDVADARRPRKIARWDEGMVGEVALAPGGCVAYVAMGTLTELDVSDPRRPRGRATHVIAPDVDTAWSVGVVAASGDVIGLGERGLSVWRPRAAGRAG